MKKLTFAIAAIAVLIAASFANGASKAQQIHYNGIWCKSAKTAVVCTPWDGNGYTVGMNKDLFIVMHNDKTILTRENR